MMKELLIDKSEIRRDRVLRLLMRTGIPLAVVALVALWAGQTLGSPLLGMIFVVTMPLALLLGLVYNIRFIMLANRMRKERERS